MTDHRSHFLINGFNSSEAFRSKRTGRNPVIPPQNRTAHGQSLSGQFTNVLTQYQTHREQVENPITQDVGIYVEIISADGCEFPLDNLDTRDFNLRYCKKENEHEVALVFIPESRRNSFHNKLQQYLDPNKDGANGPRNHSLVDSIAEIKLANLKSFWTDDPATFPENSQQEIWWELWLKNRAEDENPVAIAQQLAERINATLGNTSISFFDSTVLLIKASANQLEHASELIANLEELRLAKETPNVIVESSPTEQQQWAAELLNRLRVTPEATTAVCILDTGVNYNHQLLRHFCNQAQAESWNPAWPHYDEYAPSQPYNAHGSIQAGIASFGDLQTAMLSHENISISYTIESGRILPPAGTNDPELYGAVTVGTAAKLEIERPDLNRVYSLAVTSAPEREGGQPSSWSAEIDQFSSGLKGGIQRLFVISAGNNTEVDALTDYWDQVHLAQIEDPAQSWNALTVGAYTEKTTNDDTNFVNWSPFATSGDVAPASRSSVNWGWRKQSPFKPDVVAEGGNRLLSPNRTEVSNADVVLLISTSGRTTGQLFETTGDTSAASALVSRQAAILMAEYPEYWPESIRGLIVHSAAWTPRMLERFVLLNEQHSPKVAKETMLRTVGYGVPNLERAQYSADHALTLVAQHSLQPFIKAPNASNSDDPKLNEMQLYQLPWPIEALQQLPPELEIKLKVTLSYFVEPNPGRRGYRRRYSYQSHGLRFEVIRPGQSLENFQTYVNGVTNNDEYDGPEGNNDGWTLGTQLRTRGSLHADTWTGAAADLADMHTIAVFPVGGWWKYRTAQDRWQNTVRYSLIVSIDVPDENIDIYSVIENLIEAQIEINV